MLSSLRYQFFSNAPGSFDGKAWERMKGGSRMSHAFDGMKARFRKMNPV